MKLFSSLAVLGVFAGAATGIAADEKKAYLKCPVSCAAAKTDHALDYNGGKVYFCCENCPKAFSKDTAKFEAKANHQLFQTAQLKQVACQLTGKDINPDVNVEVASVKVGLCCNGCKGKVAKATGDEQIALVFKDTSKGFKPAKEEKK